jgi:hypothetical protein
MPIALSNRKLVARLNRPHLKENEMELKRAGTRPIQKGSPEWFTGEVAVETLSHPPGPSRIGVAAVTFQPGARTAWHTHPLGQTLVVTSGRGWTRCEGEDPVTWMEHVTDEEYLKGSQHANA